jgi:hypothetical protein
MMRRLLTILVCAAIPGRAIAQDDFSHVKAKAGQHLLVTVDGLTASGVLKALTPQRIVVGDREFVPGPGLRIERENGNTVVHDMWIGAAITAAVGFVTGGLGGAAWAAPAGAFMGASSGVSREGTTLLYLSSVAVAAAPQQLTVPATEPRADLDFSHISVKPGQLLTVTDGDLSTAGILSELSADRLVIGTHQFTPHQNLHIEREGDPVWDGATSGFLAGVLLGPTVGAEACLNRPMWHCVVEGGVGLAVIGALLDWANTGRTTVYDGHARTAHKNAWLIVPAVDAHTKSVTISKQFK